MMNYLFWNIILPQISEGKEKNEEQSIQDSGCEIRSRSFPTGHESKKGFNSFIKYILF